MPKNEKTKRRRPCWKFPEKFLLGSFFVFCTFFDLARVTLGRAGGFSSARPRRLLERSLHARWVRWAEVLLAAPELQWVAVGLVSAWQGNAHDRHLGVVHLVETATREVLLRLPVAVPLNKVREKMRSRGHSDQSRRQHDLRSATGLPPSGCRRRCTCSGLPCT